MTETDAGPKAVYEALRCGRRAQTPWEAIGARDQAKFRAAFDAGLAAHNKES